MHNLNKAGGLTLTTVINELAVLQLPLPPSDQDRAVAGSGVPGAANAAAVQLRPASPAETRYAAELLARLLDMGYMRRIAAARRRMAGMPEGSEKLELLGEITKWRPLARTCKRRSTVTPSAESSIFRRLPSVAPPDAAPLRVMPMASRPVFSCVTDELLAVIPSSASRGGRIPIWWKVGGKESEQRVRLRLMHVVL